ncbi:PilZ domain-containing protein [Novosphingobium umbonatum]|uniref:PilZ domain-containing protein n=1 Tax=Novosphingobium umbonatum TaxID=1908524 RepID=A0A3S2X3F1_9SPHN|nr:PilZ domain-containing protein [Novosphingobium umbonatum]RVU04732.1 PilZ domain-containing protein [Novosphingobium umbonatum]
MAISDNPQRGTGRDSLFLLANLRVEGSDALHSVRIRNLSRGGLMAEASLRVICGLPVQVELRQLGWIDGVVAWVQDNRFGIAFDEEVDPVLARPQHTAEPHACFTRLRTPASALPTAGLLRKV